VPDTAKRRLFDRERNATITKWILNPKQSVDLVEEALMADILQFRPRLNVFAPELTSAMGDAYDKAIATLSNNESELIVRELVAKRIVRLARRGERDPEYLCSPALFGFRKPRTAA
jgi:hypothetical protein